MRFELHRKKREDAAVNVLPVMNLFAILVPFLLLASIFNHVGTIPSYLPWATSDTSSPKPKPRSVTVNLFISPQNIQITATHPSEAPKKKQNISLTIPKTARGFNFKKLQDTLYQVKLLYENSDTIILFPTDDVPYEQIVQIVDTAREITFHPGTDQEFTIPLFPVVVFSRKG